VRQGEYRKIKTLKKLPGNPRIIKDAQFKTLCNSIKENPDYFEARPLILSNRTGELIIIAGNQRYEAAKHIGLTEAPCFLLEGLTEEREREIIIRDNVANGAWDFDALANGWADLPLADWGVELPEIKALTLPSPDPQQEPQLKSECFVEIYCTKNNLDTIIETLNEWSGLDGFTINIS